MKVVLFCGGLGTRLREHSDTIPKPLVSIGNMPVLWHLMRYYAHYGHKDFILCLGYRGDMIRDYFLNYSDTLASDFTLSHDKGERKVDIHGTTVDDWRITFVDTGLHSNIGQRLLRVRKYLQGEEMFLANYADGLSNLPIDRHVEHFKSKNAVASFVAVRSAQSFHSVQWQGDGVVSGVGVMTDTPLWINGGYFVLKNQIFDYINEGEELVEQPFTRLIAERKLVTNPWEGFWQCMDTFKDKIVFDRMEARGACPWMVWNTPATDSK